MVAHRYIISTTDRWSSNVEAALANQIIETSRISITDIASALLNWDVAFPGSEIQVKLERKEAFQPRKHFGKGLNDEEMSILETFHPSRVRTRANYVLAV